MGLPKLDKLKDAKGWRAFRVDFWAMCVVEECVDAIDAPMRATREQQRRAHALLTLHVEAPYKQLVTRANSASEAWLALTAKFRSMCQARLVEMKQSFSHMRMRHDMTLEYYFSVGRDLQQDINEVVDEVGSGSRIEDADLLRQLVAGLGSEWGATKQVLLISIDWDLESVEDLLAKLQAAERTLPQLSKIRLPDGYSPALAAGEISNRRGTCWRCGEPGHVKRNCPKQQRQQQQEPKTGLHICPRTGKETYYHPSRISPQHVAL